jgi:hypothetical protein
VAVELPVVPDGTPPPGILGVEPIALGTEPIALGDEPMAL